MVLVVIGFMLVPMSSIPVVGTTEEPPHWGPTNVTATYDAATKSTTITWDNLPNAGTNHQIWVWRHSEPASNSTWETLNKSTVHILFDTSLSNYTKSIDEQVERSVYYSVTYDNGTYSDARFLDSNTMTTPIIEDTIVPELIGQLTANTILNLE